MLEIITEKGSMYRGYDTFNALSWFDILREKALFVILMKNGNIQQYYDKN